MEQMIETDRYRLGVVRAVTPDGLAVLCTDGLVRGWPKEPGQPVQAHDLVALGKDNQVRTYVTTLDGQMPKEALDTQIFTEVRTTGKVAGLMPRGEQERINHRNELEARYQAQSRARAIELVAAGVLHTGAGGEASLAPNWKAAYVKERQGAALSPLGEAPVANKHQGVVRDVGVLTRQGQRGIALDTPKGSVVIPTSITTAAPGQVVEFERGNAKEAWGMRTMGQETAKKVVEAVKKLHKEREAEHGHHHKRHKRRDRDLER